MKQKRNVWLWLDVCLLLLTLAFIWGNSMLNIPASQKSSSSVLELLRPLLSFLIGAERVTEHLVRKLAHFTEFAALGAELALLAVLTRRVNVQGVLNCLSAGLAAAVADESIQILSHRGAMVADILLDFCGATSGVAVLLLLWGLMGKQK